MHHLHAGAFHCLELLDHLLDIALLASMKGCFATLVYPFVWSIQLAKPGLPGKELGALSLEIPPAQPTFGMTINRFMDVLLINKAIDGVLPDRMIELGSI